MCYNISMKKLYILLTIFAVLSGIPAAQAQTEQTLRVLGEQEKTCLAKQDIYRLQVPIIGCTPSDTVCCSDDGIYTIGLKGAPSYIATMVRFGIIVVITIMFLMLIVAGVQFQLSFGNTTSAYKALDRVKRAAMGLVVVLFSTVILYQINPDLIKLKMATPEGIAPTVCCKIPTGVKQPINQVTKLVYGATQKLSSTIVSQTPNADHSVTVKWSSGETSTYRYKYPEGVKFCTLETKDSSGKVVFSLSPNFYMLCPTNIIFPSYYTVKVWEIEFPDIGRIDTYELDPSLNTCKIHTVITNVNSGLPSVPIDCPDDTVIPDLSPPITWKEVLAANIAAAPASLLTSADSASQGAAFTYYMATEFKGKEYVCNGSDQVEADVNKCIEGDPPEPSFTGAGSSGHGKNPTNITSTRTQLLASLKGNANITFLNPRGKDGLDLVKTTTLKALTVATGIIPKLTINSLDRPASKDSPHQTGQAIDFKTVGNTLTDADIEKLYNGLDVDVVTQFLYCKPDSGGDMVCPPAPGVEGTKCSTKWIRAWPRPFNAKQIDVACGHRDHLHISTVDDPMTLNNQSSLALKGDD